MRVSRAGNHQLTKHRVVIELLGMRMSLVCKEAQSQAHCPRLDLFKNVFFFNLLKWSLPDVHAVCLQCKKQYLDEAEKHETTPSKSLRDHSQVSI